ncbi:MAG: sigma-70 family RNA polymerase sigma factor [Planctomycetota bacterium]
MTDADLLDAWVRDQHPDALEQLVERYQVMVLSVCRRHCRSEGDIDDAFQTTWVCLAHSASQIRDGRRLAGWLHRVAMRAARQSRQVSMDQNAEEQKIVDRSIDVLEDVARRHDAGILDEELLRLPAHHQTAILLHVMHGETYETVAERLDTTINSVRGWVQRGKKTLARRLRHRGVVPIAAFAATLHTTATQEAAADCVKRIDWSRPEGGDLPDPAIDSVDGTQTLIKQLSFLSKGNGLMKVATWALVATTMVGVSIAWLGSDGVVAEPPQLAIDAGGSGEEETRGTAPVRVEVPKNQSDGGSLRSRFEKQLDETYAISAGDVLVENLADVLTDRLGLPVMLDRNGIEDVGEETLKETVTIVNEDLPLRSVLFRALEPLKLAADVRDEGVFITADYAQLTREGIADCVWVKPDQAVMDRLLKPLDQTVAFRFLETSFGDAIAQMAQRIEVPIILDVLALGDLGIDPEEPVTLNLANCSAHAFFDTMLSPLEHFSGHRSVYPQCLK